MKVAFIMPARNKAANVGKTVDTILAQTYSPLEILLSDQGSEDDTLGILKAKAQAYSGPNAVRVLECPDREFRGRAGLNRHYWWIVQQTDADIIIVCAADDLNHKDRALHTVRAFEEFNPSHVGTRVRYVEPNGDPVGETMFPERRSRFIGQEECFRHLIGSSASASYARDLIEKYWPLEPCESEDMIMPILALFERGFYYVDKPLHTYVRHADPNNTGLEGLTRSKTEGSPEWHQSIETQNYHMVQHWTNVWRRLERHDLKGRLEAEAMSSLVQHVCTNANFWALARNYLTEHRIPPQNMVM